MGWDTQDFYLHLLLSLTWYHILRLYIQKWQTEQETHLSFKGDLRVSRLDQSCPDRTSSCKTGETDNVATKTL